MTTLLVSEFKAKCLSVLDRVQADGTSVLITRRGRPLARVVPAAAPGSGVRKLGSMADEAVAHGDLVHADFTGDWESPR